LSNRVYAKVLILLNYVDEHELDRKKEVKVTELIDEIWRVIERRKG